MDDPTKESILDSWPAHLATAALTGVATACLPVQRWSRGVQWSVHGGMGALSAGAMAYGVSRPLAPTETDGETESSPARLRVAPTVAIALLTGVAVAGVSRGGQAADTWIERRLVARGVRRPRAWMGVAAAGMSVAMSWAEVRKDRTGGASEVCPDRGQGLTSGDPGAAG